MSNLGPKWEDDEDYSPARMDAKSILRDSGSNIVAIAPTRQLGLVCPTDTSGGLIKNVVYYVDYNSSFDRIGFEPIFHRHTHSIGADTDEDGGSYLDIRIENISEYAEINLTTITKSPADLWDINALNGTITYVEDGNDVFHRIDTLSTAGNYITADLPGIRFQWDNKLICQFNMAMSENTNILSRIGVGIDRINETPSTSRRMMALEGCDGHGTNWVLLNANGNSGSLQVTATTMPLLDSERDYKLVHIPADSVTAYYNLAQNAQSTTNVADDSYTDMRRTFRWGVKLPTGTDNITMDLYWFKMIGNHLVTA